MNKFVEYLNFHYNKNENRNLIEYTFKNVPDSFVKYYEDFAKEKQVFWTPKTLSIISMEKVVTQEEIDSIKRESQKIKKEQKHGLYDIEDIPSWYYDFYKSFKGLSLYRGSISFSISPLSNMMTIKPKCLKGKYYIGAYSGTTQKSCPIFVNEKGNVFVYEAENFRNYPAGNSKREIKTYLKQKVRQIAYWESFESFLIDECERLNKLFEENPSIYAIKDCAPKHENF